LNLSNDPEQKYFSEGVAEEILSALSNLLDLKVAGRTSSFQFQGKEVGRKVGVRHVLEGSVRKQGNRLRVTVQLVNVEDGFHLWSEKYERNLEDIFSIQDEIATAVTEKLKGTIQANGSGRTTQSYTQNPKAYELYLKGRFFINQRGASILTGIKYCQQALELDPSFALAHASYADGYLLTAFYGLMPPSDNGQSPGSGRNGHPAGPRLCEPYCSLGFNYACCEWNWAEAEKNYWQSIALNLRYAQPHAWYGITYLL
jgi:adenylate cyclase